ncbi:glycosyltransferase [Confluentibacter lentus]|uniref:glycosyltransferase n=1 Tax=Confluentibacter lentus TaxID=1699412 RepID=UPI000C291EE9|nr:glycosyltransferase [Confluentibacter lentus]
MNKITLITAYYYPEDTAIGLYNLQMVEYMESKGYEVNVITGFPNYPQWKIRDNYKSKSTFFYEKINKTNVSRYKQYVPANPTFFKRILLIMDFTMGSFFNIIKIKKCDLVICVVPYTSTILLGWILKVKCRAMLWNHVQDFEFDAAKETGISSKEGFIKKLVFKILFKIESFLLNKGDINSTISNRMFNKLESKSKTKSFYFPNWIDHSKIDPSNTITHKYLTSKRFKILYSGNIGDKQDWKFFLKFAHELNRYEVDIIIVGDGAMKNWLCKEIKTLNNVKYYPPVDYNDLSDLLCSTDLHILFQKSEVVDSVMPSKLLGMMASGKPSLITGNINSEVKIIIEESNGGYYIENNNIDMCISIINNLIKEPKSVLEKGINARKYIIEKFSGDKVLSSFEIKLSQLI